MHPLLLRQIKKHIPKEIDQSAIRSFLDAVDSAYIHSDEDRKLMEHSIEINSKELMELYEEQRRVREEIETLFDNLDEIYFTIDANEKLQLISPACTRIYGYTQNDFYRRSNLLYALILKEDRIVFSNLKQKLILGESITVEYRIKNKDKSIRWLETKLKPFISKNVVTKINGVTSDITIRKETENKIRESEDRFRAIINSSHDIIQSINSNGAFEFVNQTWFNTLGYNQEDLGKMNAFSIIENSHKDHCMQTFSKVIRGVTVNDVHTQMVAKNGTVLTFKGRIIPRMLGGQCIGSLGFFHDVTEQERIEAEKANLVKGIFKSEEKFRSLFDNSRDPILILDENNTFINCNTAALQILKADCKEQIVGLRPLDISPKFQNDGMLSAEKAALMNSNAFINGSVQFEWQHTALDGSFIEVDISLSKIPLEDVNIVLVHWRDISARLRAEKDLKRQYQELKKANSELDRFVYSVSHDLRAPLCSILGITELIMDGADPFVMESLQRIQKSVNKLDNFILDILNYSRNSRMLPQYTAINCNELISEITGHLQFMNGSENQSFDITVKTPVPVITDKSRLTIILNNLLSNSIRYRDLSKDKTVIAIAITADEEALEISVTDNGIGIGNEQLPYIFDMFYRGSESSVGSGLGLYIVKEAVDKLKGDISIMTEEGTGTTFRIAIPNNYPSVKEK